MERVIRGGTIVTPTGQFPADIGISGGIIAAIGRPGSLPGDEVVDVTGHHVLPGVIDPHVHFRDPGQSHKEDVESGSAAAAAGGVTLVIDMPATLPLVTTPDRFEAKKQHFAGRCWVNFSLWALTFEDNYDQFAGLAAAGAVGVKALMAKSSARRPATNDAQLFQTLEAAAAAGLPVGVHAENDHIIDLMTERLKRAGRNDLRAHGESRPPFAEAEAVARAIQLAAAAGCPLHIAHLSTAAGLEAVRRAKADGKRATCETCPQYLYMTQDQVEALGPAAICNPPVRYQADVNRLLRGLTDGEIDCIATDHAPHPVEDKLRPTVWEVLGGQIGVETVVPLMLNLVHTGHLPLERLAALASENTARVFGLYPRKGALQVGSDADLTVVDMALERVIRGSDLHSKVKQTAFEGMKVRGWPVSTIVRGQVVMRHGELCGRPSGTFVPGPRACAGA